MQTNDFNAAIVGRFQPFHNGHLQAVLSILEKEQSVLIIIGTSQESGTDDNPYSFELRSKMILEALKESGVDLNLVKIVPLPDINDDSKWVDYLIRSVPKFKVMYTGSKDTAKLFAKYSKITVKAVNFLDGVSGTLVRKRLKNNMIVSDLVPSSVLKLI